MIPVCTAEQTRALDNAVVTGTDLSGRILMEIAGRGIAEIIHEQFPSGELAILCGPGNNGGDGYVAARWLVQWGRTVRLSGPSCKTEDAAVNRVLCERMDIPILSVDEALMGADIAVDALLGTGASRAPSEAIAQAIRGLNTANRVVSVDIPTGIQANTGAVMGVAVEADLTVTLGRWKPGLLAAPGCDHAGDIYCVDIGLDLAATVDPSLMNPIAHLIEESDIDRWRPQEGASQAKWDRGHVGIIGGGGAATLAAHGAFRGGAGLVTLFAPKPMWETFHGLWPEVILAEPEALNPDRHDAIVIGPGLGTDTVDRVCELWADYDGGVVADADALTILASHSHATPLDKPRIMTPHTAEAGRILGLSRSEVEADRFTAAYALSQKAVSVLKGPHSIIGGPQALWVNPTGCNRLATAGTGDVLAGMIAGSLAAGVSPERAAAIAVWDHGVASTRMPQGGTARDLIDALHGLTS